MLRDLLGGRRQRFESRIVVHEALNHFEVLGNVGRRRQHAARLQNFDDLIHKVIGENPALAVFRFPPGIWKVDMDDGHALGSDQSLKGLTNVAAEHPGVLRLPFLQSGRRPATLLEIDLDAEVVPLGMRETLVVEKEPSTAADIYIDGILVAEEPGPDNRCLQEIADVLYLPVGTIKSRLFSIREHLKQQLKEPK